MSERRIYVREFGCCADYFFLCCMERICTIRTLHGMDSAQYITPEGCDTYKILIMSNSRLIASFIGSRWTRPCSAKRACCKIFWVLLAKKLISMIRIVGEYILVKHETTKDSQAAVE